MNVPIILNAVPDYIKSHYPKFIELLTLYYDWLNTETDCAVNGDYLSNLDVFASTAYLDNYLSDLGFSYSRDYKLSKRLLITLLKEFYLNKGNSRSFEFIFRAFFGSDVTIEYPRERLFTLSDSVYSNESFMYIRVDNSTINGSALQGLKTEIAQFESVILKGTVSGATVQIEKIDELTKNGNFYLKLQITNVPQIAYHTFEQVNIVSSNWAIYGTLVNVSVLKLEHRGKDFMVGDKLYFTSELSRSSDIQITATSKGSLSNFVITYGGSGYAIGDFVTLTVPSNGCLGTVSRVSSEGSIEAIKMWSGGTGLDRLPKDYILSNGAWSRIVQINSVNGSGAVIRCESVDIGGILAWSVIEPHFDFTLSTSIRNQRTGENINNFSVQDACIFTTPKSFKTRRGFLGENSIIIDSLFYQQFSYALKSNVSSYFYADIINELLHPIGYVRLDTQRLTDDGEPPEGLLSASEEAILRGF